jgi:mRNA export factor
VLCSAWNADGSAVFSGGCDNQVKKWDLATNQPMQVAGHDAPIRHLAWIPEVNLLVTGSWDKTLKYWWGAVQVESS